MNCKNCGAAVKDEDVVCSSCGAELSESLDISDKESVANNVVSEEVNNSITDNDETGAEESTDAQSETADTTDVGEDGIDSLSGESNTSENESNEDALDDGLVLEPVRKKTGLIAVLSTLGVLVAGLAIYIGFFGGLDAITSFIGLGDNHPLVYIKDGAFYFKDGTEQNQKISEKIFKDEKNLQMISDPQNNSYTTVIKQRDGGKLLYFFDNITTDTALTGDLKVFESGGKTKTIAQGVYLALTVSEDGSKTMFLENYKQDTNSGDLYICQKDGQKEKLASGVGKNSYKFSRDGKTLMYVENSNNADSKGDLCVKTNDSQKKKIDSGAIFPINVGNDGDMVVYVKKSEAKTNGNTTNPYDLYIKESGKDIKCIANNINNLTVDNKNKCMYVLADIDAQKQSGVLYYKEYNKDKVKVDDNVVGVLKLGTDKFDSDINYSGNEDSDVLYVKDFDTNTNVGDLYFKHANNNKVKVASKLTLSDLKYSEDLKTIAFYRADAKSGEVSFYTANASDDRSSYKEKSISDKVSGYGSMSKDGGVIMYPKKSGDGSMNELYLLNSDGKSEKIANSTAGTGKVSKDGKSVLFMEEDNGLCSLYVKQPGKDKVLVSNGLSQTDASFTYDFKKIYYFKGYDAKGFKGDLYMKGKGKNSEKIDSGVTLVLFSE